MAGEKTQTNDEGRFQAKAADWGPSVEELTYRIDAANDVAQQPQRQLEPPPPFAIIYNYQNNRQDMRTLRSQCRGAQLLAGVNGGSEPFISAWDGLGLGEIRFPSANEAEYIKKYTFLYASQHC